MSIIDLALALKTLNPLDSARMIARRLAEMGHRSSRGTPYSPTTIHGMISGDYIERSRRGQQVRVLRLSEARLKGRHTRDEWAAMLAVFSSRCVRCGTNAKISKDHVLPLCAGGADSIDNLQPLCRRCNSSRGSEMADHRDTAPTSWTPHRIRALRLAIGESVDVFGARFGRSGRTVEDWEQSGPDGKGRRRPDVMVLLAFQTLAKRRKFA